MRLQDAGITLLDCDHRTPKATSTGYPYVTIPQMQDGEINLRDARTISSDDYTEWTKKTCPKPFDVLLSRRCNPGETAYVRSGQTFAVGQNLVLLRSDGAVVAPRFLRWMTRGQYWWDEVEKYRNQGAVFDSLKCRDIINFKLPIPPRRDQEAMAHLLDTLDNKIELNRRASATLEEMVHALFKSWFVEFDPVRAKAEGRLTGLSEDISTLFPERVGEDGVPEGWTVSPLSSLAQFLNGLALQKYPAVDGEASLPVIKIAELRNGPTAKSGKASNSLPAEFHIRNGDHLFSWSGSLTHCLWTYGAGALNQHLFKVSPYDAVPDWLVFEAVEHHLPAFQAIAAGKAVTMGHIQRRHLDEAQIAMPPAELLRAMDTVIAPLHVQRLAVDLQSRTLAELRDSLLPRLVSGEVRIKDAERMVGEAA